MRAEALYDINQLLEGQLIMATTGKTSAKKATPAKKTAPAKTVVAKKTMSSVVGVKSPPSTAVPKKVWEYIKKNSLQDKAKKS
jgi:chromatin remodeling complex protein RSC6